MPPERDHFAAYSFVDRIVEFESGRHGRGTFAIPAALDAIPPKPKNAATSARMKKAMAQLSMTASGS